MALSDKGKMYAIVGAMVVDKSFRDRLYGGDDDAAKALLAQYATMNGFELSRDMEDSVLRDFLRKPCTVQAREAMNVSQPWLCPCWPCSALTAL